MASHKFFNDRKYFLCRGRWMRTTRPQIQLSHDIWNYYNPNDRIEYMDEQAIHHVNEDASDDRIENLEKMSQGEHMSLHLKGNHYRWKGGLRQKLLYLGTETIKKNLSYEIFQYINSLGEIKGSYFHLMDRSD